jgi:hypothetical protein
MSIEINLTTLVNDISVPLAVARDAYQLAVAEGFEGTREEWLAALVGPPGDPGEQGADGREVELRKSSTHVQWRYVGDETWLDLVPLADIKGDTGEPGAAGATGAAGPNTVTSATTSDGTASLSLAGLTTNSGTITTSQPVSITQTWNASGVTFTGLQVNVTDTASGISSYLMDLQTGGTTRFSVRRDGVAVASAVVQVGGDGLVSLSFNGVGIARDLPLHWTPNTWGGASNLGDLRLYRDAANTLAQRNGTNAQTFRLYGTYTDASNYRRIACTMSTAGAGEIKAEGAGTGASGNTLTFYGICATENDVVEETTTARTLALTDSGKYIRCTNSATTTITVPTDSSVNFPTGSVVYFRRHSGALALSASGVTINNDGAASVPAGGVCALKKVAANTWDFI